MHMDILYCQLTIYVDWPRRKPAGYGFVKYRNAEDAAEAKHHMNNQTICGHQISVVFSKEDAKRPEQMLAKEYNT